MIVDAAILMKWSSFRKRWQSVSIKAMSPEREEPPQKATNDLVINSDSSSVSDWWHFTETMLRFLMRDVCILNGRLFHGVFLYQESELFICLETHSPWLGFWKGEIYTDKFMCITNILTISIQCLIFHFIFKFRKTQQSRTENCSIIFEDPTRC